MLKEWIHGLLIYVCNQRLGPNYHTAEIKSEKRIETNATRGQAIIGQELRTCLLVASEARLVDAVVNVIINPGVRFVDLPSQFRRVQIL